MNLLVIGGVAAGTKVAAKAKRVMPDAKVTIVTKGKIFLMQAAVCLIMSES